MRVSVVGAAEPQMAVVVEYVILADLPVADEAVVAVVAEV